MFVIAAVAIIFAPYAEINRAKQNTQIRGEALQNHGARKSVAVALFATSSVGVENCKAQTSAEQSRSRPQYRRGTN
jgi:hypothetical protein